MPNATRLNIVLGFAAIYIIWGSTYLAIGWGVETMPPFIMAGVRFLIGGGILYWWAIARGAGHPQKNHWLTTGLIGLLLTVSGVGLVTWAEKTVPTGITALMIAMVPMWIVLIDWLRPNGTRPGAIAIFGVLLGFGGVAFLINPTDIGGLSEIDHLGAFLIAVACFSWALGSVYSRYAAQPKSQALSAGMQMITGGAVLIILAVLTGEHNQIDMAAISAKSLWSVVYLFTIGSFTYAVYIWLMKASTPARVSTYAYVNPIIALFLGSLLNGEALSNWALGCSVVIILAVVLIISTKARAQKIDMGDSEISTTEASDSEQIAGDSSEPAAECC